MHAMRDWQAYCNESHNILSPSDLVKAFEKHPIRNTVVCSVYTRGHPSAENVNSAVVDQLYEVAKQCSQSLCGITSVREARYHDNNSIEVLRYSGMSAECTIPADHVARSLSLLPSSTHNGTVTGVMFDGPGAPAIVIPSFKWRLSRTAAAPSRSVSLAVSDSDCDSDGEQAPYYPRFSKSGGMSFIQCSSCPRLFASVKHCEKHSCTPTPHVGARLALNIGIGLAVQKFAAYTPSKPLTDLSESTTLASSSPSNPTSPSRPVRVWNFGWAIRPSTETNELTEHVKELLTALFHKGNQIGGKKYSGTEAVIYIRNHTTDGARTFADEDAIPTKEAVTALFSKLAKKVKDRTAAESNVAASTCRASEPLAVPVPAVLISAQQAAGDRRLNELVRGSWSNGKALAQAQIVAPK